MVTLEKTSSVDEMAIRSVDLSSKNIVAGPHVWMNNVLLHSLVPYRELASVEKSPGV